MQEIREIDVDKIVHGHNVREQLSEIESLAQSIKKTGLINPIRVRRVRGGFYEIVTGHRRYEAFKRLHKGTIPAVLVESADEESAIERVVENLQREDLRPIELARGIQTLLENYGLDENTVAQAVGQPISFVRQFRTMSLLPDEVLLRLESGKTKGTHQVAGATPRHIARGLTGDVREKLPAIKKVIEMAEKHGWNVHQSDAYFQRIGEGESPDRAAKYVTNNPDLFRYPPPRSPSDVEEETWKSYYNLQIKIHSFIRELRPQIAQAFDKKYKQKLASHWEDVLKRAGVYYAVVSGDATFKREPRLLPAPKKRLKSK